jgi:hypothetical protein
MFKLLALPEKAQALLYKFIGLLICGLLAWAVIAIFQAKNEHITDLNTKLSNAASANKELKTQLEKKGKSDVATQDVVAGVKESLDKQESAKVNTVHYVDRKVVEIRKKYSQLPATPDNEAQKAADISLERMKGLWMTYCLQDATNDACKNKE